MTRAPIETNPLLVFVLLFLAICAGTGVLAVTGEFTDRSTWSTFACVATHEEPYSHKDVRPHAQGGRGGEITGSITVCDAHATVGPVMPRGWRP